MKISKIRPIPQKIIKAIKAVDLQDYPQQDAHKRFYSYFAKNEKELVLVTVAVKNYRKQWYCKQVVVHGVHSDLCFIKDIKFTMLGGYSVGWYDLGIQKYQEWYENGWDWQYDKNFNIRAPIVNKTFVLENYPEYKYSAIDLYPYGDCLKYLRIYEQYPQAEYFVKAGMYDFATKKTILRQAKKDKAFRNWILRHRSLLKGIYAESALLAYKTGKGVLETQRFLENKKKLIRENGLSTIQGLFKGDKELQRFFTYIASQRINYHTYLDYIKACSFLKLDLTEDKNLLPHDFIYWHKVRIDQYYSKRAHEEARRQAELVAKFQKIAEKYLPLQYETQGAYIALIAQSPNDLKREGEFLHHCVGMMNYDQKMIREETIIFFVRLKTDPDRPLVTIEYSPSQRRVLQCRGEYNAKPDEPILDFVNKKWLPFANKQIKRLAA